MMYKKKKNLYKKKQSRRKNNNLRKLIENINQNNDFIFFDYQLKYL